MTEEASIYNGLKIVSLVTGDGKLDRYVQKNETRPHILITPHTRINSKWIKDLKDRPETIKILGENIGSKISEISYCNISANMSPWAKETEK